MKTKRKTTEKVSRSYVDARRREQNANAILFLILYAVIMTYAAILSTT
ncbi:hypothetical protein Poly51_34290 [Rubripirellula tenax]|uniref:Uncharacterized protein n=2 Tax=Rubripirellula TaxID=1579505 RepID=A0A5C6F2F8_9BACT|nr:hypothetical protein Poly51_34290 [Rubripirellula tenax]TWU55921.1 hypothetical protein Poly59_22240 [Rubripirellula reticaptiva]